MALSWRSTSAMPRLRTYKEASDWEANTKPIRGDSQGLKPLGKRNQKWRHIRREADGTITIHETSHKDFAQPLIRFHPDDTVSITPSSYWLKATGHDILRAVLGINVFTEAYEAWVKCAGGTYMLRKQPRAKWDRDKNEYVLPEGAVQPDNRFKWVPNVVSSYGGSWTYLNPPKAEVHVIDRKGAKAVRERYAAFSLYLSAMTKLRKDNAPDFDEYVEAFGTVNNYSAATHTYKPWWAIKLNQVGYNGFNHNHAAVLCKLMQSDKPEDQYRAYLWLVFREWSGVNAVKRMERVLMMHHHDEMLQIKEKEPGEKCIDRYAWAIPE